MIDYEIHEFLVKEQLTNNFLLTDNSFAYSWMFFLQSVVNRSANDERSKFNVYF